MVSLDRLAALRQRLINRFGTSGVHMLEHGAVGGAALGLWFTFPVASAALLIAIGAAPKRAGPLAVLAEIIALINSEDARLQESYLVGAFLAGSVGGAVGGSVLRVGAAASGVDVPTAAEVLRVLA